MKFKKLLSIIYCIFIAAILCSCGNRTAVIEPEVLVREGNPEDCWLISDGKYFYGFASQALDEGRVECVLAADAFTFISNPVCYSGKIFLGDQGTSSGKYGCSVFVLDEDCGYESTLSTVSNIRYLVRKDNLIIADSLCYYSNSDSGSHGGFSVIDADEGKVVFTSTDAPDIIANEGSCWSYGDDFILGFWRREGIECEIMNLHVEKDEGGTYSFTESTSFMCSYLEGEEGSFNVCVDGKLCFINFKTTGKVFVFDLEGEAFVMEIDLVSSCTGLYLTGYRNFKPLVWNGKYYLLAYKSGDEGNSYALVSIDTEDYSVSAFSVDTDLRFVLDYTFTAGSENNLLIHTLGQLTEIDLSAGKAEETFTLLK